MPDPADRNPGPASAPDLIRLVVLSDANGRCPRIIDAISGRELPYVRMEHSYDLESLGLLTVTVRIEEDSHVGSHRSL